MLATMILMLCNGSMCVEKAPFAPMPMQVCAIDGQMIATDWLRHDMPGYRLQRFTCQLGERKRGI